MGPRTGWETNKQTCETHLIKTWRQPKEIVKKSAEYGFAGIYTSADYGGCELGRIEASLIFEALAESSVNISAYISIHNMNCWFLD